jgi:anti-sigma regulatory factor (Ser/Thr protein kinase)
LVRGEAFTVPADPSQVAAIRARLRALLGTDHQCAASAELVISELATNAIVHGCGPDDSVRVSIRLLPRSRVAIAVTDSGRGSSTAPQLRPAGTDSTNGRGLFIVASLATRWSVQRASTGYRVRVLLAPQAAEAEDYASALSLMDFSDHEGL